MINKTVLVVILILLLTPIAVYAWNDCPYGIIDDPFPGQCARYVDTNNDGLCDHSQSHPQGTVTSNSTTENQTGNGLKKGQSQQNNTTTFSDIKEPNPIPKETYFLIPLAVTITILYLVTYLLFLENKLKRRKFYRIWNYVLSISFVVSAVTGVLLIIFINYGVQTPWNDSIDFWHAEFAIVMAFSTIFHIHLYWNQFKKIFR
jgi:hypothetical protein